MRDEEINEADKIKQTDAHYQRYPKGPTALLDLPAVCLAQQVQDRARTHYSSGLVPFFCGERERALIRGEERVQ